MHTEIRAAVEQILYGLAVIARRRRRWWEDNDNYLIYLLSSVKKTQRRFQGVKLNLKLREVLDRSEFYLRVHLVHTLLW